MERYGKRPHDYFSNLISIRRENNETYRGLMFSININLKRCTEEKDPIEVIGDEFFLRALANGKTERFHVTFKLILKKLCATKSEEWDTFLPYALFAYREVPHEETGFSPFELLYGWPVRGPTQIYNEFLTGEEDIQMSVIYHVARMRNKLKEMSLEVKDNPARQRTAKTMVDKSSKERRSSPGDEVLVLLPSDTNRIVAQWKGPYRVIEREMMSTTR
ncbi:hypothetical protein FSP39_017949 [Pinctada imbricata]|uniref:Uncharacterized protein n=1 Tax=Pinctada imbricata TaxID=66713 RepID=A0AA88Y9E0_PINIB|nr:hypothetical protein FSP39_017949 [Pinctada imbricata]